MGAARTAVSDYIDGQPAAWRPTLERLRALCRRELPSCIETFAYGLPSYARDGEVEVAFGKRVRYLSLYILKKPVLDAHRSELARLSVGKCCIRYTKPEDVDWGLVAALLADSEATDPDTCA